MKFSLIAAVVVLALAQGSYATEAIDMDTITQYFEDMKTKITQELTTFINTQDLANQAQTFLEEKRTQLEPLSSQIQEQIKTATTTVEEQIKPLAASVQTQIQPLIAGFQKQMEDIFKQVTEEARAIGQ